MEELHSFWLCAIILLTIWVGGWFIPVFHDENKELADDDGNMLAMAFYGLPVLLGWGCGVGFFIFATNTLAVRHIPYELGTAWLTTLGVVCFVLWHVMCYYTWQAYKLWARVKYGRKFS